MTGLLMTLAVATSTAAAPDAGGALAAAHKALLDGSFDRALKLLSKVDVKRATDAEAGQVWLVRAQCHLALQAPDKADAELRSALERDASIELDPNEASPALVDALAKARREVKGDLSVDTSEPGAEIRVDGADMGPSPLTASVPVGRHQLEATSADGKKVGHGTTLVAHGQVTHEVLQLEALPAAPPPNVPATATPAATAATTTVASTGPSRGRSLAWVPLVAGGVLAGVGVGTYVAAKSNYDALTSGQPGIDAKGTASSGSTLQTASVVLWVCGAVSIAAGVTLYALPKSAPISANLTLTPSGLVAAGTLP